MLSMVKSGGHLIPGKANEAKEWDAAFNFFVFEDQQRDPADFRYALKARIS